MGLDYRVVDFSTTATLPVGDIARLHSVLLPESPVARLGNDFMQRFYYKVLVEDGLIFGSVAYVDGQPAGFIAATDDSAGFMRTALRRHMPYLVWVIAGSLIFDPGRWRSVWGAFQVIRQTPSVDEGARMGELLTFGVLPEYRELDFVRRSGVRISLDLFEHAKQALAARGAHTVRAKVAAENIATQLFYQGLGWPLVRSAQAGPTGRSVEFVGRI